MGEDLAIHVGSAIRRGAGLHPEREAIVFEDRRLTYGELDEYADRLGAALGAAGVRPGARVAILGRNNIAYAAGMLSLSARGFTAVPLNWRLSDVALAGTAAKYDPEALLFTRELAPAADTLAGTTPSIEAGLCLDDPDEPLPPAGEAADWARANYRAPLRADLFAFISTGGTEGVPKGVPVTNAMVEACTIALMNIELLRGSDATLVLPQMFHNPHLYLIAPLMVGGKLVVPEMPSFDAELVLRTIESERVTRFMGVATMMAYLLDAQERIHADISSVRTISYGGAPFAARTITRLIETFDCDLIQLYGQTETSVLISALRPDDHREALADPGLRHRLDSAGQLVPPVEARVVADDGSVVPRDRETVGEIAVRSPSVMAGYHDAPELTEARLREGWCFTGDLGVWDEDGYLYIVDRRNDMIISGGENVFPSAVESVIRDVPGVEDVVVIGVPDEEWGEIVMAVVVPAAGQTVSEAAIASACNERLARYMRPRAVELVDELPKNPSGKVLRGEVKQRYAGGGPPWGRRIGAL